MKTTIVLVFVAIFASASNAFAGPDEREWKKRGEDTMAEARKAYKTSCGCDFNFATKWETFKDFNVMRSVYGVASNIKENAADVCKDKEAKVAMCKMKTFEFKYTGETDFKFVAGVIKATTDGHAYPDLVSIAKVLDK